MGAYIGGLFPRSEQFIERSRQDPARLSQLVREEKRRIIRLQRQLGFSYLSDPLIDWHDLFRPFTTLPGVEAGPLVRFFENNTFYRRPVIVGPLNGGGELVAKHLARDLFPRGQAWKADLPEPYTLVRLSTNHYYRDTADLLRAVSQLLAREARALAALGAGLIQLHGPALTTERDPETWLQVREALQNITRRLKIPVMLHLYFGDVTPILPQLLDLPVAGLGIDFTATPPTSVTRWNAEKALACGCVDARSTRIEEAAALLTWIRAVDARLKPRKLYVTPSCDLEFVPYAFAKRKLRVLATVARRLGARGRGE